MKKVLRIMQEGDEVINASTEAVIIRRENGEVDIIPLTYRRGGYEADEEAMVTIGYEQTIEEVILDDGSVITKF